MNNNEAHHLFHIPELVSIVCEHAPSEADLNSLARTSKIFHEPALNVLWRDVRFLRNLVQCFPSSVWEEENSLIKFKRAIKLSDWERFQFYAKRVHSLTIFRMLDKRYDKVDESVYSTLEASCFGQSLFPNLRSFVLCLDFETQEFPLPMFNMFLNPDLEMLALTLIHYEEQMTTVLDHLHKRCPKIRVFRINGIFNPDRDFPGVICSLLIQWENLNKLTLPCAPTPEALQHLARLDSLKSLMIMARDTDEIDCHSVQAEETSFSNLEFLEVESNPNFCRELLKATINSPLRDLSLEVNIEGKPCREENRKSMYGYAQAHKGLLRLRIWEDLGSDMPSMAPTRMKDIEGLLKLTHLQYFSLRLGGGTDFNDNNVREIAQALPNLEVLRLGLLGDVPMDNPSTLNLDLSPCRVTLAGVTSLIEFCPNLRAMNVRFDARTVPDGPPDHVFNELISMLDVDDCPISSASVRGVAEYLSNLLPLLEDIDFENEVDDEDLWLDREIVENWRQVEKLLKEY